MAVRFKCGSGMCDSNVEVGWMRTLRMYGTRSSECREHRTRNSESLDLRTHSSESLELVMYGTLRVWDSECMELRTQTVWTSEAWDSECMEIRAQNV